MEFIFIAAVCVGIVSWFFSIFEFLNVLQLQDWAFGLGPVATGRETRSDCPVRLSVACLAETEHVKYRVLEGNRCVFRRKHRFFELRWNTPFEIKGIISWENGALTVRGRYFLGVTLFFVAWLAGWTVGGLMVLLERGLTGMLFIGLGWFFCWGIFAFSRSVELNRFDQFTNEIATALGANLSMIEEV